MRNIKVRVLNSNAMPIGCMKQPCTARVDLYLGCITEQCSWLLLCSYRYK